MRIDKSTLREVALAKAASNITSTPMDRLPLLAIDRCLAGGEATLRDFAVAAYSSGVPIASETLTMPRSGFGPRPVNVIAPQARMVYEALSERLRTYLPEESRAGDNYDAFSAVGLSDDEESYVVEFDIASCYEYIDHTRLHEELLLQTMDVEAVDAVTALLGEVFDRPRGLPQLLKASDLLSDSYLQGIERSLLREGYDVLRYADDFKLRAGSWGRANDMIENAADIARDYGLVLSSAKTNIRKAKTVRAHRQKLVDFLALLTLPWVNFCPGVLVWGRRG